MYGTPGDPDRPSRGQDLCLGQRQGLGWGGRRRPCRSMSPVLPAMLNPGQLQTIVVIIYLGHPCVVEREMVGIPPLIEEFSCCFPCVHDAHRRVDSLQFNLSMRTLVDPQSAPFCAPQLVECTPAAVLGCAACTPAHALDTRQRAIGHAHPATHTMHGRGAQPTHSADLCCVRSPGVAAQDPGWAMRQCPPLCPATATWPLLACGVRTDFPWQRGGPRQELAAVGAEVHASVVNGAGAVAADAHGAARRAVLRLLWVAWAAVSAEGQRPRRAGLLRLRRGQAGAFDVVTTGAVMSACTAFFAFFVFAFALMGSPVMSWHINRDLRRG